MKSGWYALLILAVGAALAALPMASRAEELLTNPGWELGTPDQITTSSFTNNGWTYQHLAGTSTNFRPENKSTFTNQMIRSGLNALRSSANSTSLGGEWLIYQDVPASRSAAYTASVWILPRDLTADNTGFDSNPNDVAELWIQELNGSGGLVVDVGKFPVTAAQTGYVQRSITWTTASSGTEKIRFMLHVKAATAAAKSIITFDDASLDGPPASFTVTGTVTSGGSPVSGADVTLTTQFGSTSITTASNGSYTFSDVQAGDQPIAVRVSKSGYYSQRKTRTLAAATTTVDFSLSPLNLLQDAGFDDGWPAAGWNTDAIRAAVTAESGTTWTPMYWDSGEDAVVIHSPGAYGDGRVWQTVSVQPNNAYTASVAFRAGGGDGNFWGIDAAQVAALWVKEFDSLGNLLLEHPLVYASNYTDWETLTDSFTTTSQTAMVQIGAYAYLAKGSGSSTHDRAIFDSFVLSGAAGPAISTLLGTVKSGSTALVGSAVTTSGAGIYSTTAGAGGGYSFDLPVSTSSYTVRAAQAGYYAQRKSRVINGPDVLSYDLVPVGQNLLINAGLDDGYGSDWVRSGITGGIVGQESGTKADMTPYYYSGEQATRFYAQSGNGGGDMWQTVPVLPGMPYTASVRFRAAWRVESGKMPVWGSDPNQKASFYVREFDSAGTMVAEHKVDAVVDPFQPQDWQLLTTGSFTTTATTVVAQVGATAFMVDSYNNWGLSRALFDSFEFTGMAVSPVPKVSDLRALPEGEMGYVQGKVVTCGFSASPDKCFYIEDSDRVAGIKVTVPTGQGTPARGEVVNVYGKVETVNGERRLTALSLNRVSSGAAAAAPIGLSNRSTAPEGLAATGLYVTVWGKVDDVGGNPFTIDDGSGVNIKVYASSSYTAVPGDYVTVVGALGSELSDGSTIPVLRATSVTKKN